MRLFSLLLPLTLLALPVTVQANEPPVKTLEDVLSKTSKSDGASLKDRLPDNDEIEAMIDDLPDFNHLLDGLIKIAQDEKIRERLEESAEHMKNEFEKSGAMELRDNGLPDINAGLAVMLRSLSDEKGLGGMLGALDLAGDDLGDLMDEAFEDKPKDDDT